MGEVNDARPRCEHGVVYPQENCASCLRAERDAFSDKALRFDLDRAGIERREREAVELVELRAERERNDVAFELLANEASLLRAERDALRELLREWDSLIQHQYSGTREAMSAMTAVAQRTAAALAEKERT